MRCQEQQVIRTKPVALTALLLKEKKYSSALPSRFRATAGDAAASRVKNSAVELAVGAGCRSANVQKPDAIVERFREGRLGLKEALRVCFERLRNALNVVDCDVCYATLYLRYVAAMKTAPVTQFFLRNLSFLPLSSQIFCESLPKPRLHHFVINFVHARR
jgi:hypothetical protein